MNVAIQFLTLLSGLLINFIIPAVYGLKEYGVFIYANILVFVVHRVVDIINEPLIAKIEPERIFPVSVFAAAMVWFGFFLATVIAPIGSATLLASMLVSTCVMLTLYSLQWRHFLLGYLLIFIALFCTLLFLVRLHVLSAGIESVLIWTNGLSAIPPAIVLAYRANWKGGAELAMRAVQESPKNISMTLVFNVLTNILPYILSRTLPYTDLATFKISASVVQSVGSLFPVNSKAIFVLFCQKKGESRLIKGLLSFSLFWFSAIWVGGLVVGSVVPKISPFLGLISALPILYWAMLSERYVIANGHYISIITANIFVGTAILLAAVFAENLEEALMLYAFGIASYAVWSITLVSIRISLSALTWLLILSMPLVVYAQTFNVVFSLVWGVFVIFLAWWKFRFTASDILHMRSAL